MRRTRAGDVALIVLASGLALSRPARAESAPWNRFAPPQAWQARFWADPAAKALLDLDAKAIAALVPVQAGFRFCRCPKCGAPEAGDPLAWSIARPEVLTCRKCSAVVPDDKVPAKADGKVPEEVIEVLPRAFHRYPYHAVEAEKQLYPDERIFLAAKRDFETREYLAKAALYAASAHRHREPGDGDPRYARMASALLVRFAQVYPSYATHFDRPGVPKFLDRADLPPPYRRDYGTAKWDWSGATDVPMNLVVAHALVRDDPAMIEAGKALGEANPHRLIERDLFRASAEFTRSQPEESTEMALSALRGLLAAGRLLDDPALVHEAARRLDAFLARGFYHDGLWRLGDAEAHKRVMARVDGWIDPLLVGYRDPEGYRPDDGSPRIAIGPGVLPLPTLSLAREATRARWLDRRAEDPEVRLAAWPASPPEAQDRRPALLGGAGIARLGIGRGADALDVELRGLGDYGAFPSGRLALRVGVGGRPVLGDLEDASPTAWGFERSSASRNGAVLVDGLNQREAIDETHSTAPGADIVFFAADPDFQVARMRDRHAYPRSAATYRHTVVVAGGPRSRHAVSLVEVEGGLQHDQILHGDAAIGAASWRLSVPVERGPSTLLSAGVPFVPTARPEDGRWFVQAMGAFTDLENARIDRPIQAVLNSDEAGAGVRVHLLNDAPMTAVIGRSPGGSPEGRAALILHRRSADGAALDSSFVSLIEPIGGPSIPLRRVGRIATGPGVVAIALETADGPEALVLSRNPGETVSADLPDGRLVRTDGLAVRVTAKGPILAGGTFAEVSGTRVALDRVGGTVIESGKSDRPGARGQFRVRGKLSHPEALAGRALLIRHADGTSRGWTIAAAENLPEGTARLHVREEAGFRIDAGSGEARYERFPGTVAPGPHQFGVSQIAR